MRRRLISMAVVLSLSLFCCTAVNAEGTDVVPEEPPNDGIYSLDETTSIMDISDSQDTRPVLRDIQTKEDAGIRYYIKIYDVAPGYNPETLDDSGAPFDKNGYHFEKAAALLVSENSSTDTKLASQIMSVSHATKEGAASKFAPFIDFNRYLPKPREISGIPIR